jgi:hypothetical protein
LLREARQKPPGFDSQPFGDGAAGMVEAEEQVSFRSSSRMRPLKLSTKPFCIGLPGAM